MSPITPSISGTTYGFDFYEAAYTCLGAQYPSVAKLEGWEYPKIAFSTTSNPILSSNLATNIDLNGFYIILLNASVAHNILTNQIGVEFYTTSWKDAISLGKSINLQHTNYGDEQKWNYWWKELVRQGVNLNDFYQLGISHTIETISSPTKSTFISWLEKEDVCPAAIARIINTYVGDVKDDDVLPIIYGIEHVKITPEDSCYTPFPAIDEPTGDYPCMKHPYIATMRLKGRIIVPPEGILVKYGSSILKAQDIFDNCSSAYNMIINLTEGEFEYLGKPGYFDAVNTPISEKNWTGKSIIGNPYGIEAIPMYLTSSEYTLQIRVPQTFFQQMRLYPEKLSETYNMLWQATITEKTEKFIKDVISKYVGCFGTGCDETKFKFVSDCGLIFENIEALIEDINDENGEDPYNGAYRLKKEIRQIFELNYNCYAREFSKAHEYGDLLQFTGRMYNKHGSEFWYILKQVLRPRIVRVPQVTEEVLGGFTMPNETFEPPLVQSNDIIPTTTTQYIEETKPKLSEQYTKDNNKICGTLPPNLKYK